MTNTEKQKIDVGWPMTPIYPRKNTPWENNRIMKAGYPPMSYERFCQAMCECKWCKEATKHHRINKEKQP
jgi:hypothetical protein